MAAESSLPATATLGTLDRCRERFSATDVSTRPELSHCTVLDPQRGDFGWVAEAGRALLRRAQDEARTRQVPQLSLSVGADNYARMLCTAEGFVDVPGRAADGVMAWSP